MIRFLEKIAIYGIIKFTFEFFNRFLDLRLIIMLTLSILKEYQNLAILIEFLKNEPLMFNYYSNYNILFLTNIQM